MKKVFICSVYVYNLAGVATCLVNRTSDLNYALSLFAKHSESNNHSRVSLYDENYKQGCEPRFKHCRKKGA